MQTETILKIETSSGKVAAEVLCTTLDSGKKLYRYAGAWGAGCGSLEDITRTIELSKATRKGWKVVQ
jgi:hypothetical protein